MGQLPTRSQRFLFACNLVCLITLLTVLGVTYVAPQYLPRLSLNVVTARMLILQVISLMLLLAYVQRSVTPGWRTFTLFCSFAILVESWLVAFY